MSKKTRTAIAILFALAFFASAPIVVLHTQGYRYDWRKAKVVKTGILRIESVPTGATVFINERPTQRTTPAIFFRTLPEQYDVRLTLAGRLPWERTLTVRSGGTTFASGIRLVRDVLPTLTTPLDADMAAFTADAARIAFTRTTGEWTEVGIAETRMVGGQAGAVSLLSRSEAGVDEHLRIEWSPNETRVLVTASREGVAVATVYAAAAPHNATTLHDRVPGAVQRVRWDGEDAVLVITSAGVHRVTLGATGSVAALPGGAEMLDRIALGNTHLSLVQRIDGAAVLRGTDERMVLPLGAYTFLHAAGRRALVLNEDRHEALLLDLDDGIILSATLADHAVTERRDIWDGLLLWNDFEIIAMDATTGRATLVTRVGTPIRDVRPLGRLPFIAYATDGGITLIEREDINGRASYPLIQFPSVGGFGTDIADERLLFLGAVGNQRGVYARGL